MTDSRDVFVPDERSPARRHTRREALAAGLTGAAGLALTRFGVGAAAAAAPAPGARIATVAGAIDFFGYLEYDLHDVASVNAWRKANNVALTSSYSGSQSDITTKFGTGAGKGLYNLSNGNSAYMPYYTDDLKVSQPIDLSLIPNYQHVDPYFRVGPVARRWWNFAGHQWAMPFTWGYDTLNYDASKIPAPKSWVDLLRPEFKGKVGMANDPEGQIYIAAQILKIANPNGWFTKSQMNDIIALLLKFKQNARTITPSWGDMATLFASGEIVASITGFPGLSGICAQKGKKTIKGIIPSEGSISYIDCWWIPAGASDLNTVHAFINEGLTPEAQAQEAVVLVAGAVNPKAVPMIPPSTRSLVPYSNIAGLFAKAPLFGLPIGAPAKYATLEDWTTAWEKVESS